MANVAKRHAAAAANRIDAAKSASVPSFVIASRTTAKRSFNTRHAKRLRQSQPFAFSVFVVDRGHVIAVNRSEPLSRTTEWRARMVAGAPSRENDSRRGEDRRPAPVYTDSMEELSPKPEPFRISLRMLLLMMALAAVVLATVGLWAKHGRLDTDFYSYKRLSELENSIKLAEATGRAYVGHIGSGDYVTGKEKDAQVEEWRRELEILSEERKRPTR